MCRRDDYPPYDTRVRVIWVRPESPGSVIWAGLGETREGKRVRFLGEEKYMRDIYEAMEEGDVAMVDLPPEQIIEVWNN